MRCFDYGIGSWDRSFVSLIFGCEDLARQFYVDWESGKEVRHSVVGGICNTKR